MITDVLSILARPCAARAVFPLARDTRVSSDLSGKFVIRFGQEVSLVVVDELAEELARSFDDYELNEAPTRDGLMLTVNGSFEVVRRIRDMCVSKYCLKKSSVLLLRVMNSPVCTNTPQDRTPLLLALGTGDLPYDAQPLVLEHHALLVLALPRRLLLLRHLHPAQPLERVEALQHHRLQRQSFLRLCLRRWRCLLVRLAPRLEQARAGGGRGEGEQAVVVVQPQDRHLLLRLQEGARQTREVRRSHLLRLTPPRRRHLHEPAGEQHTLRVLRLHLLLARLPERVQHGHRVLHVVHVHRVHLMLELARRLAEGVLHVLPRQLLLVERAQVAEF